ncbi:hypothetical protein Ancab_013602 [Ancistrocladus abbreviatus]
MSTDTNYPDRGFLVDLPPDPKGHALSGKIMLSAIIVLFAVVFIMVCLHIYARRYILRSRRRHLLLGRRRTHLVFYVEPNNPGSIAAIPTRGLDASVLKALPTFTYSASKDDRDGAILDCAVCLSEFEEGEKGRLLPRCNHSFHIDCIDMWFHSHSTCPLCRTPVDGDLPLVKKADEGSAVEGGDVVVEIAESTRDELAPSSELCGECRSEAGQLNAEAVQPSSSSVMAVGSPSIWARRKKVEFVGVEIEVPRMSESLNNLGGELGLGSPFKSPTSRILSLKRILSREKRPLPSPSGIGTSCAAQLGEFDIEQGRVETHSSRTQTPRHATAPLCIEFKTFGACQSLSNFDR